MYLKIADWNESGKPIQHMINFVRKSYFNLACILPKPEEVCQGH